MSMTQENLDRLLSVVDGIHANLESQSTQIKSLAELLRSLAQLSTAQAPQEPAGKGGVGRDFGNETAISPVSEVRSAEDSTLCATTDMPAQARGEEGKPKPPTPQTIFYPAGIKTQYALGQLPLVYQLQEKAWSLARGEKWAYWRPVSMDTDFLEVVDSRILYRNGRFATTMASRITLTIMSEGTRCQVPQRLTETQVLAPSSSLSLTHAVRLPPIITDTFLRKDWEMFLFFHVYQIVYVWVKRVPRPVKCHSQTQPLQREPQEPPAIRRSPRDERQNSTATATPKSRNPMTLLNKLRPRSNKDIEKGNPPTEKTTTSLAGKDTTGTPASKPEATTCASA